GFQCNSRQEVCRSAPKDQFLKPFLNMVFPTHHHHLIETQCCNVLQCSNSFKRGVRFPPSFGGLARLPGTQVPIRSASQTSSAARIRRASTTRASGAGL